MDCLAYKWPSSLVRQLDTWMQNFVWTGNPQDQKPITVVWHWVCAPLEAGGLAVHALDPLNKAGILRFVWDTMHTESTWRDFMHAGLIFLQKPSTRLLLCGRVFVRLFLSLS